MFKVDIALKAFFLLIVHIKLHRSGTRAEQDQPIIMKENFSHK
jgi:hypothetical protein